MKGKNLAELSNIISGIVKTKVQLIDSAAYGYVVSQIEYIRSIGEDPREYEIIMCTDEFPKCTENGMKITNRIRLMKREDIE